MPLIIKKNSHPQISIDLEMLMTGKTYSEEGNYIADLLFSYMYNWPLTFSSEVPVCNANIFSVHTHVLHFDDLSDVIRVLFRS